MNSPSVRLIASERMLMIAVLSFLITFAMPLLADAQTSPQSPTAPTAPTSPTAPTGPSSPTNPTSPSEGGPTDPTDDTDPTDPTCPTDPTNPTNPTGGTPTNPTNPTSPNTGTCSSDEDDGEDDEDDNDEEDGGGDDDNGGGDDDDNDTGGGNGSENGNGNNSSSGGGNRSGGNGTSAVLGASTDASCSPLLHTYIRQGYANDMTEVRELQEFLNQEIDAGLPVTGYYGPLTESAVNAFQKKYSSNVLAPWVPFGLPSAETPTGYVFKTTQRMINNIHCPSLNIPLPLLP